MVSLATQNPVGALGWVRNGDGDGPVGAGEGMPAPGGGGNRMSRCLLRH